jgi:hypothetical protein
MVVAITCCFIHREVRIEFILYGCQLLKKIKCLQSFKCMQCLDSDYIRQLRYLYHEQRGVSIAIGQQLNETASKQMHNRQAPLNQEERNPMISPPRPNSVKVASNSMDKKVTINSRASVSSISSSLSVTKKCCCCLFSENKNDFFNSDSASNSKSSRRKHLISKLRPSKLSLTNKKQSFMDAANKENTYGLPLNISASNNNGSVLTNGTAIMNTSQIDQSKLDETFDESKLVLLNQTASVPGSPNNI